MSKKVTNLNGAPDEGGFNMFDYIKIRSFEDVSIRPFKTETIRIIDNSQGENEIDKRDNKLFEKIYKNKVKILREIKNIPLENLVEFDEDDLVFNAHDDNTHGVLKDSIKKHGLFSPVILWNYIGDKYYILSGYERVKCYCEIYFEGNDEVKKEFETISAFVLEKEEINDFLAREIYIDSNLSQRKLSPMEISRALSVKCGIRFKEKEKRNELNIMDEMVIDFNMSRSSLYNYKKLEKLIKPLAYLLEKEVITLKNAVKLASYPEEIQVQIVKEIGLQEITNEKMNLVKLENVNDKKEVERIIRKAKEYKYPGYSSFTIRCMTKFTGKVKEQIDKYIKKLPREYFVTVKEPKVILD